MKRKKILAMILAFLMLAAVMPALPAMGAEVDADLILWYDFHETSDKTVADVSGNANDATLYGDAEYRDDTLYFGGANGYAQMPNGVLGENNELTIALYVKPEIAATNQFTWTFGNNSTVYMFLGTCNAGARTKTEITTGSYQNAQTLDATPQMATGKWGQVVVTFSGSTMSLYKDGVLAESREITVKPSDLGATTQNFLAKSQYADAYFRGSMLDFRVYARALSAEEIAALHTECQTRLAVMEDRDALSMDTDAIVTEDLTLETVGSVNGSTITWASDNEAVIAADGTLTRPAHGSESASVTLTASLTKDGITLEKSFTFLVMPEMTDAEVVTFAAQALQQNFPSTALTEDLTLPTEGILGVEVAWATSDASVITADGVITRPPVGSPDASAVLTATITVGAASGAFDYPVTVRATAEEYAYLFAYFTGNTPASQQMWYAISTDGYHYTAMNGGDPVMKEIGGTGSLRDPYIFKGEDGFYYCIVTDMNAALGWNSNHAITTWRSADLIHWTDETITSIRMFDGFGATDRAWAPQAIWCPEREAYMIYFAIREPNISGETWMYRMYASDLCDSSTYTTPELMLKGIDDHSAIDGDIVYSAADDCYYMYYKDETAGGIYIATAKTLSGDWTITDNDGNLLYPALPRFGFNGDGSVGTGIVAVEGSAIYKLIDQEKWIVVSDAYTSGSFLMAETTDLVHFNQIPRTEYSFDFSPRHAGIITISEPEYHALVAQFDAEAAKPTPQTEPIVHYEFEDNAADSAGTADAILMGGAAFGEGHDGGRALVLDGINSYAQLPAGVMANLYDTTVSAWIKTDEKRDTQRVFDLGTGTSKYLYLTPSFGGSGAKFSITTGGTGTQQASAASVIAGDGEWAHIAFTLADDTATLYVNGVEVASNDATTLNTCDLGWTLNNYIGKSNWSSDPYFKGSIDDFRIYNRALSASEIAMLGGASTRLLDVSGEYVKTYNLSIDYDTNTATVPVVPGHLDELELTLTFPEGTTYQLKDAATPDYSGDVVFTATDPDGTSEDWTISVRERGNSILGQYGYFADVELIALGGKFYLYPTTDGFASWGGYEFHTFSSPDLVNWTDEGIILNLPNDTTWSSGNAWAPTIVEKNGKYYYYYSANQTRWNPSGGKTIGVAVSDSPNGPFVDPLGQPMIYDGMILAGGTTWSGSGQEIDPMAFCDPQTGKYYLFWGNGYLAGCELSEDMTSLVGTPTILTPPNFTEGIYVFYRDGQYYFTWSSGDTRSPDYHVRYGVSDSPLGPINGNSVMLQKDPAQGIFGTAHHSVLNIPGTDDWYICYHRFNYPTETGDTYSQYYGTHREPCIDRLTFEENGQINPVTPTHEGITEPVTFSHLTRADVESTAGKQAGDTITTNATVQTNEGSAEVTVIVALFSGNQLLAAAQRVMDVAPQTAVTESIPLTIPAFTGEMSVKVFTWNTTDGLIPLSNVITR